MFEPSCLGPHSLGFPPPRNLPPTISALSHKMISTSYPSVVDLVKLDLVHMQMTLFTHEGVKSSSYDDPFSHYEGFYSYFWNVWASLPIYSSPKWNQQNLIFQFAACKFWNITVLHSQMLLVHKKLQRIELRSLPSSYCSIHICWTPPRNEMLSHLWISTLPLLSMQASQIYIIMNK